MSNPHAKMRFSRIATTAILPDGRRVSSTRSYPLGVGYDVYQALERANTRAFGTRTTRTIGTPIANG